MENKYINKAKESEKDIGLMGYYKITPKDRKFWSKCGPYSLRGP